MKPNKSQSHKNSKYQNFVITLGVVLLIKSSHTSVLRSPSRRFVMIPKRLPWAALIARKSASKFPSLKIFCICQVGNVFSYLLNYLIIGQMKLLPFLFSFIISKIRTRESHCIIRLFMFIKITSLSPAYNAKTLAMLLVVSRYTL